MWYVTKLEIQVNIFCSGNNRTNFGKYIKNNENSTDWFPQYTLQHNMQKKPLRINSTSLSTVGEISKQDITSILQFNTQNGREVTAEPQNVHTVCMKPSMKMVSEQSSLQHQVTSVRLLIW